MNSQARNKALIDSPQDGMSEGSATGSGDTAPEPASGPASGLASLANDDRIEEPSTNDLLNVRSRILDLFANKAPDPQGHAIATWLDDAQAAMTAALTSYLPVEFEFRYTEFKIVQDEAAATPSDGVMAQLFIESVNADALMTMSRKLIRLAINASYGGATQDPKLDDAAPFTEFERSYVGNLCRAMIKSALRLTSSESALSTSLTATFTPLDEPCTVIAALHHLDVTWELQINDHIETCHAQIPVVCLASALAGSDTLDGRASAEIDAEWSSRMRGSLNNTITRLKAVIRLDDLSLSDVSILKVGSTIEIGRADTAPLTVESEQEALFSGRMGQMHGNYAVNIEQRLKK